MDDIPKFSIPILPAPPSGRQCIAHVVVSVERAPHATFVAAVPQSTANPPIPAMNQHALATISDLAEGLAVEVIGPFALLLMPVPAIECDLHSIEAEEGW